MPTVQPRPDQPPGIKPRPRRERSRSLQHVPITHRQGPKPATTLPAIPAPPRPKSPAPELRRFENAARRSVSPQASRPMSVQLPAQVSSRLSKLSGTQTTTPLQRRNSGSIVKPVRGDVLSPSARTSRSAPDSPALPDRLRAHGDKALPAATRKTTSAPRHFSSDARLRIKRRSTPPEFTGNTPPVEFARPERSRSNPASRNSPASDVRGRTTRRVVFSRSDSGSNDSGSDSSSSSSDSTSPLEKRGKSTAATLSAHGLFLRYVTNANLMAGKRLGETTSPNAGFAKGPPPDHETISMLTDTAPKRILHIAGLCSRFIELEHAKYLAPETNTVHFGPTEPDFYSTINLNTDEFGEFYQVHSAIRQYLLEQMRDSALLKDFGKQVGVLFARIKGLASAPDIGSPMQELRDQALLDALEELGTYTRELVDAIHGARSRGTLAAPNWATSRLVPPTVFLLVKRLDGLMTILLLEDPAMSYEAIKAAREKLMAYLLFDSTIMFMVYQHANPFTIDGPDFRLYAKLQQALADHLQKELAHESRQFFEGLMRNTNTLGLSSSVQNDLATRAHASPDFKMMHRHGASPRTNFIARTLQSPAPAPVRKPLRNDAWIAAFLAWLGCASLPAHMQEGFRKVLDENRNNPDIQAIQSACVIPIHDYARNVQGRDATVDAMLIRLIRKLRNETFEFQHITPDAEKQ